MWLMGCSSFSLLSEILDVLHKVKVFNFSLIPSYEGSSRAFLGRDICHFMRRDIGKLDFKIAGNGIRYTHGTGNFLIFLLGKREKYEMIA